MSLTKNQLKDLLTKTIIELEYNLKYYLGKKDNLISALINRKQTLEIRIDNYDDCK